jgi:hypothetical protein
MGGSRWVGRKSFKSKTKKRNWVGGLIRAEKGQTKKVNLGWHRDRKENPLSVHHPSTLVHWWVLVHSGHNEPAPPHAPP